MKGAVENRIARIIEEQVKSINRPDLYRTPMTAYSAADDKGYPQLKELIGTWHQNPCELLPDAKSVISYFVPFTKAVAAGPKKVKEGFPLWAEAYQEINQHFNVINEAIANYLTGLRYSVLTIKPTHTYDPKDLQSMWSHRSAAAIAGMGTFGANRLLITEKGSAGRFCTVITSAALEVDQQEAEERCLYIKNGKCGLCFKSCPVQAFSREPFDKFACQDELNKNNRLLKESSSLTSADTCGKCISVCPYAYID